MLYKIVFCSDNLYKPLLHYAAGQRTMSVDLSRPAVASMGNLDPYDGLGTYSLLNSLAERSSQQKSFF
jgi:hypothetical protein